MIFLKKEPSFRLPAGEYLCSKRTQYAGNHMNWESNKVSPNEAEQVFFNHPPIAADDVKHSETERRCFVLGQTDNNREFFVVYTLRGDLIRVISARDMNRREGKAFTGTIFAEHRFRICLRDFR